MVVVVCLQHALVNDGVTSRLANHQVSPLYDHNTREEGRVTRELQHFTLRVRLFINEEKTKQIPKFHKLLPKTHNLHY